MLTFSGSEGVWLTTPYFPCLWASASLNLEWYKNERIVEKIMDKKFHLKRKCHTQKEILQLLVKYTSNSSH